MYRILKNMAAKILYPWKRQVMWVMRCNTKLVPDKYQEKSQSFGMVAYKLEMLTLFKVKSVQKRGYWIE